MPMQAAGAVNPRLILGFKFQKRGEYEQGILYNRNNMALGASKAERQARTSPEIILSSSFGFFICDSVK